MPDQYREVSSDVFFTGAAQKQDEDDISYLLPVLSDPSADSGSAMVAGYFQLFLPVPSTIMRPKNALLK